MKKGLILEGGAMRGMFTCGVLDVFMEEKIIFDGAVGISAGAVFGCNFKSKQIGRPIRYNKKYSKDPRYCSLQSLIKTGDLYGVDFCYHELPDVLDPLDRETFKRNPMDFYIGATNIETGECEFHKCVDGENEDISWMQASASMPLVSKPVAIDGNLYLDGGIANTVPFKFMEDLGFDKNVVILTQPKGYLKKKSSTYLILKGTMRKYPKLIDAMKNRHRMYNKQMVEINKREREGSLFVIRPPQSLGIGRTEKDPDELERVYQTGREAAKQILPELKEYLEI